MNKRILGLDVLRFFAITLVLIRHGQMTDNYLYDFGWLGVDLFFVLSGYLVSGLLFKEYKQNGKARVKRFLIRRGFKIYPAFYIFLAISIFIEHQRDGFVPTLETLFGEALYLQSYLPHIWSHTWSLAVEEHFYLALAIIMFILSRLKGLDKKVRVIGILVLTLAFSFVLRLNETWPHKEEPFFSFMATHLRLDGIIVGVLVSYLKYFTNFIDKVKSYRWLFAMIGFGLVLPGFVFKGGSFEMNTFGLSTVNLGFGCFLVCSLWNLGLPNGLNKLLQPIYWLVQLIGQHSYSIYLWHIANRNFMNDFFDFGVVNNTLLYILLSYVSGILLSLIIERPFLKLRERFAP